MSYLHIKITEQAPKIHHPTMILTKYLPVPDHVEYFPMCPILNVRIGHSLSVKITECPELSQMSSEADYTLSKVVVFSYFSELKLPGGCGEIGSKWLLQPIAIQTISTITLLSIPYPLWTD